MTATVLILGAAGRFGHSATQAFAQAGWNVLAALRHPSGVALPEGARAVRAALDDRAALRREAAGARLVVYAVNPPYPRWASEAMALATAGMEIAAELGARFVLPGNVYNFGEGMPARLREDAAQQPTTRKGRIRCQIEAELQRRAAHGRLRSFVLRAGDFYGAGRGSWFDLVIVKSLRTGKLVYPGPLDVEHAWAYLPDLARTLVALAERDDAIEPFAAFHFAGHTLTGLQLLTGIEQQAASLDIEPSRGWRRGAMPWGTIRACGWLVPLWRELAEMEYLWRVPHALDGAKLEALLGAPPPATPADIALGATLRSLGFGVDDMNSVGSRRHA